MDTADLWRDPIRIGVTAESRRLDGPCEDPSMVMIDRRAWLGAAGSWAPARRARLPTADPGASDADVIRAGVAATIGRVGDEEVIATSDARHLGRSPGADARAGATIARAAGTNPAGRGGAWGRGRPI